MLRAITRGDPNMPIDARWITSTLASGLYAARRLSAGAAPVDHRLAAALAPEVDGLAGDLQAVGVEAGPFFEHAIPLAARFDSPVQLAKVVLAKVFGPRHAVDGAARLARRLQTLGAAVQESGPDLLDELELRSRPLREQWEARAGGLLATVRRLTAADVIVEAADVILVQPLDGGGGTPHARYNAISFEAVLANPIAELPEVARLGWLWAQLNLDLPAYEEPLGGAAVARIGPLALLPPVLTAAGEVELVNFDRPLLEQALSAWRAPPVEADALAGWWETYQSADSSWGVALAALAKMLGDA
jgi:hypothetical protein